MMKNRKKMAYLTLGTALSLTLLTACGGGGSTQTAAPEKSAAPVASAAPEPEKSATPEKEETSGSLKTVEAGKLYMATNAAFPPYEMTTDDGGYEGIDVEVATAIAEKLGLELVVDDMDFNSVITSVQQSKDDMAMAGLTVNEERKQNVDFTTSYATGVQVVIVKENSDVTLDNLDEQMIGTQEGTTGFFYCSDDYGDDHVTAYSNGATAVQALLAGSVDCVVIDNEPAKAFVAANDGLVILDTEYVTEDYAIGISKNNPDLLKAVNGALEELISDGTVDKIIGKYIKAE